MTHSPNSGFANESFSYDANGNRNAAGQTTGTGNEIQSDGTYNYAYDPAGNLIGKISIATGVATLYKYDYRNRLTEVDSVVGGVASIVSVFTYDALNRQIGEADYPTTATAPTVGDAGFEEVSMGSGAGAYAYNPSGSAWTFSPNTGDSGSGLSGNNSAFTSGNAPAPQGSQVAFLQAQGTISQAISFAAAGNYQLTFDAAECASYGASNEQFNILVDGTVVASFSPTSTAYQSYTTPSFAVGAGSHTIEFQGYDPAAHKDTVFLDAVSISVAAPAAPVVGDAGFEAVAEGSGSSAYTYDPTGSAWSFAGSSGLSGNNSNFTSGNPNAPQGSQVAFLQAQGSISQTITFAAAGSYQLTFDAAQRENFPSDQSVQVLVDGTVVGTITPAGTTYGLYATSAFSVSAGAHTVTLRGTSSSGYDTAFIDAVSIAVASPVAATYVGDAGFEAVAEGSGSSAYTYDPTGSAWSFAGSSGLSGNNSNFTSGNPNAPQGSQVAFLQAQGSISQTITFAAAGSYQLTFDAAQRENFPSDQSVQVLVDGTVVGTITPAGTTYGLYATPAFSVSAGAHTITLRGTSSSGNDTAFIDAVTLAGLATPVPAGASAVRWTVYDGQTPLLDFNGFGQQTARYLSVPGAIDELLARQTASGVAWYLDDREGSVGDLINDSGAVLDHVDYTAFGLATDSVPTQGDRFNYAGMEFDAAIGLYYDRARYYDPATGKFLNNDPIGPIHNSNNLYEYVLNSPCDLVDHDGHNPALVGVGIGVTVATGTILYALLRGKCYNYVDIAIEGTGAALTGGGAKAATTGMKIASGVGAVWPVAKILGF